MKFTEDEIVRIAEQNYRIVWSLDGDTCTLVASGIVELASTDKSEFGALSQLRSILAREFAELLRKEG